MKKSFIGLILYIWRFDYGGQHRQISIKNYNKAVPIRVKQDFETEKVKK